MKTTTKRKLADKFGRGMFAIFFVFGSHKQGLNDHVDESSVASLVLSVLFHTRTYPSFTITFS